jgi:hypothetical protein
VPVARRDSNPLRPHKAPQTMRVPAVDDPFVRILRGTRLDELPGSATRAAGPAASTLFQSFISRSFLHSRGRPRPGALPRLSCRSHPRPRDFAQNKKAFGSPRRPSDPV